MHRYLQVPTHRSAPCPPAHKRQSPLCRFHNSYRTCPKSRTRRARKCHTHRAHKCHTHQIRRSPTRHFLPSRSHQALNSRSRQVPKSRSRLSRPLLRRLIKVSLLHRLCLPTLGWRLHPLHHRCACSRPLRPILASAARSSAGYPPVEGPSPIYRLADRSGAARSGIFPVAGP